MFLQAPHVIPYQGSKRKLAFDILKHFPRGVDRLYEPFAGSAAITLAAAKNGLAKEFVIGDKFACLVDLWGQIISSPEALSAEYSRLWNEQLSDPASYFLKVRDDFNTEQRPAELLYLVARCVKNSLRFNSAGKFNQGADKRRLGLKPEKVFREAVKASNLLKGKSKLVAGDFRDIIKDAGENDLVYMDPPWQGTSGKRDPRYAFLLQIDELLSELDSLNGRNVPYILSFDGACGDMTYGEDLPESLGLTRIELNAGRSSQATLLGRDDVTIESLYLSPSLTDKLAQFKPICFSSAQVDLFEQT